MSRVIGSTAYAYEEIYKSESSLLQSSVDGKRKDIQQIRYNILGTISPKPFRLNEFIRKENKQTNLEFEITLPGLGPRKVFAPVRPGYSTYVELHME